MKKLILLIALATAFVACEKNEPKAFEIDPAATVNIKPAAGTKMKAKSNIASEHLTNLEIVKQTFALRFTHNGTEYARGFDEGQRDTTHTNPMLKMWGTDILYYEELIDGTQTGDVLLAPYFLEASGCVLETIKGDTIAYIPNAVLRDAESRIKALFNAKDYQPIYKIFNDAYTFIPITGSEYRELESEK